MDVTLNVKSLGGGKEDDCFQSATNVNFKIKILKILIFICNLIKFQFFCYTFRI